jgi:hypothetical protein
MDRNARVTRPVRALWVFMDKDSKLKKGGAGTGRLIAAELSLPGLKAGVSRA